MPYVQHTPEEVATMLAAIGVDSIEALFSQVPEALRVDGLLDLPRGLSEMELAQDLQRLAGATDDVPLARRFQGAGQYHHYIPAVVDHFPRLGEFLTGYTPYQAEASQGTLTYLFEFQTLCCRLTGMPFANASMYDGSTALIEALLMAGAAQKKRRTLVVAGTIHPEYRAVIETYLRFTEYALVTVAPEGDVISPAALDAALGDAPGDVAAVAVQQPNFFGRLEAMPALAEAAHRAGALFVASIVDPLSLAVLQPPGAYDADITVGEGQALGSPPQLGGPGFGFFATRPGRFKGLDHLRKMPGRIVGETTDTEGRTGYVLALQTREQHIRRARATSNICTSQSLIALRAVLFLAIYGPEGFVELAARCAHHAHYARETLGALPGFSAPEPEARVFREFVLTTPEPAQALFDTCAAGGMLPGVPLSRFFPARTHELLVATSELTDRAAIDALAGTLTAALAEA